MTIIVEARRGAAQGSYDGFGGAVSYFEDAKGHGGKVVDKWTLNVRDPRRVVAEMEGLARQSQVQRPDFELLLSWPLPEQPSQEETRVAVLVWLEQMSEFASLEWAEDGEENKPMAVDLRDLQMLAVVHGNTGNHHVHLLLNRVHPVAKRAVKVAGGHHTLAAQYACRRTEARLGWSTHPNHPQPVLVKPGVLAWAPAQLKPRATRMNRGQTAARAHRGVAGVEVIRSVVGNVAPGDFAAQTEFAAWLTDHQLMYALSNRRRGQERAGAVVVLRDEAGRCHTIAASDLGPAWSRPEVERRLGRIVEEPFLGLLLNRRRKLRKQLADKLAAVEGMSYLPSMANAERLVESLRGQHKLRLWRAGRGEEIPVEGATGLHAVGKSLRQSVAAGAGVTLLAQVPGHLVVVLEQLPAAALGREELAPAAVVRVGDGTWAALVLVDTSTIEAPCPIAVRRQLESALAKEFGGTVGRHGLPLPGFPTQQGDRVELVEARGTVSGAATQLLRDEYFRWQVEAGRRAGGAILATALDRLEASVEAGNKGDAQRFYLVHLRDMMDQRVRPPRTMEELDVRVAARLTGAGLGGMRVRKIMELVSAVLLTEVTNPRQYAEQVMAQLVNDQLAASMVRLAGAHRELLADLPALADELGLTSPPPTPPVAERHRG